MYDRNGRFIAKYHKYNLFNSEFPVFNIDKEEQNVYVDTEFGKCLFSFDFLTASSGRS